MKNDYLFEREFYPLKWWQLWRWNPYWQSYAYRYKWLRDANTARNRTLLVAGIICVVGFIYIWRWW